MKTFDFRDTGGLFDHFEVNREPFWPRVIWLVAGSGAWHLVVLACIVLIPPVRDAFSIAAIFSDAGFVDRAYNRTEIEDADILEFPHEKFRYPDGYFAMDQPGVQTQPLPVATPAGPAPFPRLPVFNPTPSPTPLKFPSPLVAANSPKAQPSVDAEKKADA